MLRMDSERPSPKLAGQILRVHDALASGAWLTLPELYDRTGDPVASISAQIRNLRKVEGAQQGLFEYRLFNQDEGTPLRAA
jgi:hypothetical protein